MVVHLNLPIQRTMVSNFDEVKAVFSAYLENNKQRKTPERYAILKEVYAQDDHFDIESLYLSMKSKNYRVSRATLYNTMDVLLLCGLVRKHHFGQGQAHYEKSFFNKQHDHVILIDSGEVKEFCDPRIQHIKQAVEEAFDIEVTGHQLYIYGKSKS